MPDLGAWRSSRAWLLTFCACIPTTIAWVKAVEKEALIELYNATNGASWARSQDAPYDEMMLPGGNKGWDFDGDPCPKSYNDSWHGVSCVDPCYYPIDGDDCRFGRITGLNLQFNGLEGTIPDSLFDKLINLTLIDMSHNSLSGTIPTTVGKLRNAMYVNVAARCRYLSAGFSKPAFLPPRAACSHLCTVPSRCVQDISDESQFTFWNHTHRDTHHGLSCATR